MLEFGYLSRIEDLLGAGIRDQYLQALQAAKKTKDAKVMCRAAMPIVEHAILRELDGESESGQQPIGVITN